MLEADLSERLEALRPRGEAILTRLHDEIRRLGFEPATTPERLFGSAEFRLVKDPFSGEIGLHGVWRNVHGERTGAIQLHGDGSFFAELDVAQPHPTDRRWFVEAVTAWGRDQLIKSEPRLLAAISP